MAAMLGSMCMSAVNDEQKDGDAQDDPSLDQQGLVGDLVFLAQLFDHCFGTSLDLRLEIALLVPEDRSKPR